MELIGVYREQITDTDGQPRLYDVEVYRGPAIDSQEAVIAAGRQRSERNTSRLAIENLARRVWEQQGRIEQFVWVEYRGRIRGRRERYELVTFRPLLGQSIGSEGWWEVPKTTVEIMLGQRINTVIGDNPIRQLREAGNMTLKQVQESSGIDLRRVQAWEAGENVPEVANIERLLNAVRDYSVKRAVSDTHGRISYFEMDKEAATMRLGSLYELDAEKTRDLLITWRNHRNGEGKLHLDEARSAGELGSRAEEMLKVFASDSEMLDAIHQRIYNIAQSALEGARVLLGLMVEHVPAYGENNSLMLQTVNNLLNAARNGHKWATGRASDANTST